MSDDALLKISLSAAVPLWILWMREISDAERTRIAGEAAQVIAEHGDSLTYKQPGTTATTFNALARGLAAAAYQPGGITFLGLHFCTDHAQCEAAAAAAAEAGDD